MPSTGFDSKNVAIDFDGIDISMLILTGTTKSLNLHKQSIGRAFRCEHPIIMDLVDDNRISKKHWTIRNKNYKEMNCDVQVYNMRSDSGNESNNESNNESSNNTNDNTNEVESMHQERLRMYLAKKND